MATGPGSHSVGGVQSDLAEAGWKCERKKSPGAVYVVRAKVFKAPEYVTVSGKSIFLVGSIEMGAVEDWQTGCLGRQLAAGHLNPMLKEQVDWELDSQDRADVTAMFFHTDTKAPISLLELGLYAPSGMCCPEGFYHRGNVQIACDRFGVELADTMEQLTER
ncbi:hypothetical protein DFH09DRAFT_1455842 [Mycena vulgaris]|nr:hypothetical protein DFH09DRAFT_1455842 [Mycena vulgaris]